MRIRSLQATDTEAVVTLSLRAWAPVFASLRDVLGPALFERMHPDWRADQRRAVEQVCVDDELSVWVAEEEGAVTGFTALKTDASSHLGEIYMIAVDPARQQRGIATRLTAFAIERFTEAGLTLAMVETGGDPGHAPARATYERAGFTPLRIERYFLPLSDGTPDR